MTLCANCHHRHFNASARVPRASLPADALAFANDLLGAERAELYLQRHYG
jgi:cytochrome c553